MSENMEDEPKSDSLNDDEDFWYQDELQLAAELGKSLLERNKDLETQLGQIYHEKHELSVENNILQKQIETLRELGHSKMKIYEEVDKGAQEFEKQNKKYARESKADKERIKRLNDTVENLDLKIEDLQDQLEEFKTRDRQKSSEKPKRKALSLNTLQDLLDLPGYEYRSNLTADQLRNLPFTPQEAEIKRLQESVKNLQSRLSQDQKKLDDLESDYLAVVQENIDLSNQVTEMTSKLENAKKIEIEYKDLQLQNGFNEAYICAVCGVNDKEILEKKHRPSSEIYEHDIHEIKDGLFLKLKDGGNAFGSQGSLNNAGLEGEIQKTPTEPKPNMTLLSELDQTYHKLVQKYEALVDAKVKLKTSGNSPYKSKNPRMAPEGVESSHDVISIEIQTDDITNYYDLQATQALSDDTSSTSSKHDLDTLETESQTDPGPESTVTECQTDSKPEVSVTSVQTENIKPEVTTTDSQTDPKPEVLNSKPNVTTTDSQTDSKPEVTESKSAVLKTCSISKTEIFETKPVKTNGISTGMQTTFFDKISEKHELDRIAMECFTKSIQTIQCKMVSKCVQTEDKKITVIVPKRKPKREKPALKTDSSYKYTAETLRQLNLL